MESGSRRQLHQAANLFLTVERGRSHIEASRETGETLTNDSSSGTTEAVHPFIKAPRARNRWIARVTPSIGTKRVEPRLPGLTSWVALALRGTHEAKPRVPSPALKKARLAKCSASLT